MKLEGTLMADTGLLMKPNSRHVALVTGASRGVGAVVAQKLAAAGADVVINYRSKEARAAEVAAAVEAMGRRARAVQADLTQPAALAAMAEQIGASFGQLNTLVLNASGGLERGRDPRYALRLNCDAQLATLDALLPLFAPKGVVVFVTSHWAHFYGQCPVVTAYEPVAASKRAGEDALRAKSDALAARGVRLAIVSGDIIEGTITPKLLERATPGLLAARRAAVGNLLTVEEFAQVITRVALDPLLPNGHTVLVGTTYSE